jgi:hypothetical protein
MEFAMGLAKESETAMGTVQGLADRKVLEWAAP